MPWFPDFVGAGELARLQTRAAGRADPVGEYFAALSSGNARDLETVWPVEVVIYDPRSGEVRGHRHLRKFVRESQAALAEWHAHTETVASTVVDGRAVVELLAHVAGHEGGEVVWPVAVVSDSPDERSVAFRTYFSRWSVTGHHYLRPPILESRDLCLADVVGRYHAALDAGDAELIMGTFAPAGYLREPYGARPLHQGVGELRSYFDVCFSVGGGIGLQHCAVTDDGVRCALEYNCTRWGGYELTPQAGLGVYERGPDGRLAAVRIYDDVVAPVARR